jgi:hypothetical protein
MASNIILKKSSVAARVPATGDLAYGELALNYADGKLYYKRSDNTIQNIIPVVNPGTVTSVSGTGTVSGLTLSGTVTSSGSLTLGGTLSLTSGQVTGALGFTPYNATNPSGYITSSGSITGNAGTATTLQTARTINGVSFNGSADITVADATKLPLAGGTMTGAITFAGAQTWPTFNQSTTGSAATLTTGRTIALTGDVAYTSGSFNGSANVTGTATLASVGTAGTYTKVTTDAKGRVTSGTTLAATDIPGLDAAKITSGVIDAARLPSYVDDVIEAANLASFPVTGETGKIYVALDTNKTYRWSGSAYVFITSGAVDSVAGKTGVVTLTSSDVGLGNVENKSSATIRSEITSGNVTTALGFTPYNATNPSNYITTAGARSALSFTAGSGAYNSTTGVITIPTNTNQLTNGAGYTTNTGTVTSVSGTGTVSGLTLTGTVTGSGNLTLGGTLSLTSGQVTTALGFTPYNSTNPSGYITSSASITGTAANVTGTVAIVNGGTGATSAAAALTALGAYAASNPSGYTSNTGDVTLAGTQTLTNKTITGLKETRVAVPASNIDLAFGNYFTRTVSGATTLTVSNVPASGTAASFILDLTNGGSATVNWFSGVKWAAGVAPALTAAGRDVLGFFTHDGGTTWTGLLLGKDVK